MNDASASIVGDNCERGLFPAAQAIIEPDDGLEIKMIIRLI
jgi:hypothetical protein